MVFASKILPGDFGRIKVRERMTDKVRGDPVRAVEILLEGENYQHARYIAFHSPYPPLLPRPQLRAYEVDHRYLQTPQFGRQTQVYIGEVDQDGEIGAFRAQAGLQLSVLTVDVGHVPNHFRDSHDGNIFGADDPAQSGGRHAGAAEAKKISLRGQAGDFRHQQCAVMLAARLAGGKKNFGPRHAYAL